LLKDSRLIIAGELTSKHQPDYRKLVDDVLERIGRGKTEYGRMEITHTSHTENRHIIPN